MRVWRELGRVASTACLVALLALLAHVSNGDLSTGGLVARSAVFLALALTVQLVHRAVERMHRRPFERASVAWIAHALAFGAGVYLFQFEEISLRRALVGGVLFATLMTPFAWWDLRKDARRRAEDEEARALEDARLDHEHERRIARAERSWLPH